MKKLLILLIYTWFCHAAALADVGKSPERTVENVADGVIVTYKFNDPIIRPNHLAPGSYLWEYMGFGVNDTAGEPAVPFRSDMFYVPAGCKAQVTLLTSTYRDTTLVISPATPNPPDDGSTIVIDSIAPYTGYFPNTVLKCNSLQNYHGVGLQNVTIIPIKYNYSQHKVRAYTEIKYRVTFVPDNARSGSEDNNPSGISDLTSKFLSNITLNYSAHTTPKRSTSDSTWHSVRDEPKYLIITTNEYYPAIQDFIEWKCLKGYEVEVEKLPKGSWNPVNIKFAVELHNEPSNKLDYLLIIGSNDDVPGMPFTFTSRDEVHHAVTDYEYGITAAADTIPQIFRGRITGDSLPEIIPALKKIIQYEKNPSMDVDFYKTALHCAEYQDCNTDVDVEDGYEDRAFVLTSENIRSHIVDNGFNVYRQYKTSATITPFHWSPHYSRGDTIPQELQPGIFPWNGCADSIKSIINNGALYVLYRGHGELNCWACPSFYNYDFSFLQNGNKLPVIFSIACLTGKYNYSSECFVEKALKKSDGGCVGIFAATDVSFSGYNDALILCMFNAIWPDFQLAYPFRFFPSYVNSSIPVYELGQILDQGLLKKRQTYGLSDNQITDKLFHCFGDPSMRIYTEKPQYFAEPSIFSRGDSIFVYIEDGDCKITFYDKVTHGMRSYKGNYAAYANPSDSLVICLDRHNYVPYIWDYSKDLYIQNEDIQNETRVYKGNSIYVGNNVTSTKPTGNVNIQNSNITIRGNRLELRPGTRIDKNFIIQNW